MAGEALSIRSKNSLLMISASKTARLVYVYDDNILFDSTDFSQTTPVAPAPISLALRNALFKTTPVNGCVLLGSLVEDFVKVSKASLFLSFGVLAYLPTLPDPYAANLGALKRQLREGRQSFVANTGYAGQRVWLWLISQIKWKPKNSGADDVSVSFYLGPMQQLGGSNPLAATSNMMQSDSASTPQPHAMMMMAKMDTLPDYGGIWDKATQALQQDLFALLDVSTHADLLGISFAT